MLNRYDLNGRFQMHPNSGIHQGGYSEHRSRAPTTSNTELNSTLYKYHGDMQNMVGQMDLTQIGLPVMSTIFNAMSGGSYNSALYQQQLKGPLHASNAPCPFFPLLMGAQMNPQDDIFADTLPSSDASASTFSDQQEASLAIATGNLTLSTPCTSPSFSTNSPFLQTPTQAMASQYGPVFGQGYDASEHLQGLGESVPQQGLYVEGIPDHAMKMVDIGPSWAAPQRGSYKRSGEMDYAAFSTDPTCPPSPVYGQSVHSQVNYLVSPTNTAASYSLSSSMATSPMMVPISSTAPPPLQRTHSQQNLASSYYPQFPPDLLSQVLFTAYGPQNVNSGQSVDVYSQQLQQQIAPQDGLLSQSTDVVPYLQQDQPNCSSEHRNYFPTYQKNTSSYQTLVKMGQENQQRLQDFSLETHSDDESSVAPVQKRRIDTSHGARPRERSKTIVGADKAITSRRHSCYLCAKLFTRPFNLRSHLLSHTNTRPYVCEMHYAWGKCRQSFTRNHDMLRHQKKKHPEEYAELERLKKREKRRLENTNLAQ